MKRLFTLCLALVTALSLTACGNHKTAAPSSDTSSNTTADTTASNSASASTEPTPVGHPAFTTGNNTSSSITAEDGTEVLLSQCTTCDILYPEECDAQKTIQADLDQIKENFCQSTDRITEDAEAYYQEFLDNGGAKSDFAPYKQELTCKPLRADNSVVSILFYNYTYYGGAHGSLITFARNYDAKTGKLLSMQDLGEGVGSLAIDNVVKFVDAIQDHGDAFFFEKVTAENSSVQSMLQTGNFYLSEDGLVLIDGQYLLQPYAAGIVEFTTSYDDLKGKLQDAYALTGGSTNCIGSGAVYTFDQDGQLVKTATNYNPMLSDSVAEASTEDGSVSMAS